MQKSNSKKINERQNQRFEKIPTITMRLTKINKKKITYIVNSVYVGHIGSLMKNNRKFAF